MSNVRYRSILLLGGPGSGKGTQGKILGALPQFLHISSGDLFRGLSPDSTIGQEFRSYSTKGLLVPDELTVRVWLRYMQGLQLTEKFVPEYHILLLDGIPRTSSQVDMLANHIEIVKILFFDLDDVTLIQRLRYRASRENRPDDASDTVIRKRIEIYQQITLPMLSKYPKSLVSKINANQTILEVARDTFGALIGSLSIEEVD